MRGAAIVSVGDELLAGRVVDTNAGWVCRRLREEGFPVVHLETAGDDAGAIAAAITRCQNAAEVVVVGGGLGPTADDVTREGVALSLGVGLETSMEAEAMVRSFFERSGRVMNDANRVQAVLPKGTMPIPNGRGTAPGIWAEARGKIIAVLPGVPHEFVGMLEKELLPRLRSHPARSAAPLIKRLLIASLPESELGQRLKDLMARGRNPSVGSYPGTGTIEVVVEASGGGSAPPEDLLARDADEIRRRLGDHVAAEDCGSLAEAVGRRLIERRLTIAVAESLTGGRVSDLLVSVPGISAVFIAGVIAYSNESKHEFLGVPEETFQSHGAVSELCARQMAEGVRVRTGAAIGVSTTGIAGPSGEAPGKPVGTVFTAVATGSGTAVLHRRLPGDRSQVRERAASMALDHIRHVAVM